LTFATIYPAHTWFPAGRPDSLGRAGGSSGRQAAPLHNGSGPAAESRRATLNQVGRATAERQARRRDGSRSRRHLPVGHQQSPSHRRRRAETSVGALRTMPPARGSERPAPKKRGSTPASSRSRASSATSKTARPCSHCSSFSWSRSSCQAAPNTLSHQAATARSETQRTKGPPNTRCSGRRITAFETRAAVHS
jgi:hypothetical protein